MPVKEEGGGMQKELLKVSWSVIILVCLPPPRLIPFPPSLLRQTDGLWRSHSQLASATRAGKKEERRPGACLRKGGGGEGRKERSHSHTRTDGRRASHPSHPLSFSLSLYARKSTHAAISCSLTHATTSSPSEKNPSCYVSWTRHEISCISKCLLKFYCLFPPARCSA